MNSFSGHPQGRPFLDLLEESLHLLRTAPLAITLCFYFGTLPFVLGLMFFCMDFTRSLYTEREIALAALGLVFLYVWMKVWQAIFCQRLRGWLCGIPSESWTFRKISGISFQQLVIQSTSFLVLPLALIITLPFGWIYAFYQNISILGDGTEPALKKLCQKAWLQAGLWPRQNHLGIWLISPLLFVAASALLLIAFYFFARMNPYWMQAPQLYLLAIAAVLLVLGFIANPCGAVVALNFGFLLYLLPHGLKMLTGIETIFALSPSYMLSPTVLIAVGSLTYLALEPLMKAFYVLRCFYGDSIRTGEDLKAGLQALSLRRLAQVTVLFVLWLALTPPVSAQPAPLDSNPPPVSPILSSPALDQAIDQVMTEKKYQWRTQQTGTAQKTEKGFLGYFVDVLLERMKETAHSLGGIFSTITEWVRSFFKQDGDDNIPPQLSSSKGSWPVLAQLILWILILFFALLLIRFFFSRFHRKKGLISVSQPVAPSPLPDVASDSVTAEDLESEAWDLLAQQLLQEGQSRLALRAFYLSILSLLGRREFLQLRRHKTNRDYETELRRQPRSPRNLLTAFSENLFLFERSWYGPHEATPEVLRLFAENRQRILNSLET